jgi:hypothetical protein
MSLCRSSLDGSFGVSLRAIFAYVLIFRRCFFLKDLQRRSRPPTDSITVVRAQGSTLARVHPEICRTSRFCLAVMHALGCCRYSRAPEICRRAAATAPTSPLCARQGIVVTCTSGRRCRARAPGIRRRGRSHLIVARTSWGHRS